MKEPVTILLSHSKINRNFDTSTGKHTDSYFPGDYELGVMPDKKFTLVKPKKITITKYSEKSLDPELIFLNSMLPHRNLNDLETENIEQSASILRQSSLEEFTLYTIIQSIQSSGNRPLEGLTLGNFSVLENYRGVTEEAEMLGLKTLQASSLNIVFIVDVSGSMRSYMQYIQSAVKKFMEEIKAIDNRDGSSGRIAILPVQGDPKNLKFLRLHGQPIWSSFINGNLDSLLNSLSDRVPRGNTPLYDAINLAIERLTTLDDSAYNVVVCLSDGKDNNSKKSFDEIISVVKASQIPIFVIARSANSEENSVDLSNFISMSKESGAGSENIGSFINTNVQQLEGPFRSIASNIEKAYELQWKTKAKVGDNVRTTIRISYEGQKGRFSTKINKSYTIKSFSSQRVR